MTFFPVTFFPITESEVCEPHVVPLLTVNLTELGYNYSVGFLIAVFVSFLNNYKAFLSNCLIILCVRMGSVRAKANQTNMAE